MAWCQKTIPIDTEPMVKKKKKITMDIRALNNQDIPVSHKNCSRGDYICKTKVIAVLWLNIYIKVDMLINSNLF